MERSICGDEWHLHPDGTKLPYYVQPAGDGEVLSIAGLWERSRTEDGEDVLSCALIMMPALMAEIHNTKQRMPAILAPEAVEAWLTGTPEQAKALPSECMRAHQVSTRVNSPRNNDPELLSPVSS